MALEQVEGEKLCKACEDRLKRDGYMLTCAMCGEEYPIEER